MRHRSFATTPCKPRPLALAFALPGLEVVDQELLEDSRLTQARAVRRLKKSDVVRVLRNKGQADLPPFLPLCHALPFSAEQVLAKAGKLA